MVNCVETLIVQARNGYQCLRSNEWLLLGTTHVHRLNWPSLGERWTLVLIPLKYLRSLFIRLPHEVSGTGYTALGKTITPTITTSGTTAYIDFADVSWTSSTITARGALIYKYDSSTNPAIAVLDFGADKTSSSTTFAVAFPTAAAASALIRVK